MSKIVFCKGIEEPAAAGEGIKNLRADYFDYAMIPLVRIVSAVIVSCFLTFMGLNSLLSNILHYKCII